MLCLSLALDDSKEVQHDEPVAAVQLAAKVPFAAQLRKLVRHRFGTYEVPVAQLLMGSQARLDSGAFADAIGTLRYGSTPMDQSPYVEVLRLARSTDRPLGDDELRASGYFTFANHIIAVWGDYFGAGNDDQLVGVTRNFVDWSLGNAERETANSGSRDGDDVLVARVAGTRTFQIMDGHHRVATAIASGATSIRVRRTWLSTETPLQLRLRALGGDARPATLDEPLAARELGDTRVARNCEGRLVLLLRFLDAELAGARGRRFLDVGAGFGWYCAELKRRGFSVLGLVLDPIAVEVATSFHDLSAAEVLAVDDPAAAIEALEERVDVVSCLGLGALAAVGQAQEDTARLLRAIEQRAPSVLVVEDPGETAASRDAIVRLVLASTGLRRVVDLGASDDPPTSASTRRTARLLAFAR